MRFSKLFVLLVEAIGLASAVDSIPSGNGIIQLQNGSHVYGCLNHEALFISTVGKDCTVFTADATTGVIGWQGVYLGIPQDSFPQPLLFFNKASEALQWIFAPNSQIPGILFVKGIGASYNVWPTQLIPPAGAAQQIYYLLGAPVTSMSAFLVWVPQ